MRDELIARWRRCPGQRSNEASADDRPRAGGRPRDPALDEAIILATRARLIRDGYSRMTLGDIAADAGVSRPTLYRRWDTKLDLVTDALDYGFRKQRDQYDIDISSLDPTRSPRRGGPPPGPRLLQPGRHGADGQLRRRDRPHTGATRDAAQARSRAPRHAGRERAVAAPGARSRLRGPSTSTPSPPCASEATSAPSTEETTGRTSPRMSSPPSGPQSRPDGRRSLAAPGCRL